MPILNWLTRDEDIRTAQRVPYRLLEEVPELSAGDGGSGSMRTQLLQKMEESFTIPDIRLAAENPETT
jgi:hypothetical protein